MANAFSNTVYVKAPGAGLLDGSPGNEYASVLDAIAGIRGAGYSVGTILCLSGHVETHDTATTFDFTESTFGQPWVVIGVQETSAPANNLWTPYRNSASGPPAGMPKITGTVGANANWNLNGSFVIAGVNIEFPRGLYLGASLVSGKYQTNRFIDCELNGTSTSGGRPLRFYNSTIHTARLRFENTWLTFHATANRFELQGTNLDLVGGGIRSANMATDFIYASQRESDVYAYGFDMSQSGITNMLASASYGISDINLAQCKLPATIIPIPAGVGGDIRVEMTDCLIGAQRQKYDLYSTIGTVGYEANAQRTGGGDTLRFDTTVGISGGAKADNGLQCTIARFQHDTSAAKTLRIHAIADNAGLHDDDLRIIVKTRNGAMTTRRLGNSLAHPATNDTTSTWTGSVITAMTSPTMYQWDIPLPADTGGGPEIVSVDLECNAGAVLYVDSIPDVI